MCKRKIRSFMLHVIVAKMCRQPTHTNKPYHSKLIHVRITCRTKSDMALIVTLHYGMCVLAVLMDKPLLSILLLLYTETNFYILSFFIFQGVGMMRDTQLPITKILIKK